VLGSRAESLAQQLQFPRTDHDERGLVALEPVLDEGARALHELLITRVEDGLVMKSRRDGHGGAHALVIPG
jgi:hypothetical protein